MQTLEVSGAVRPLQGSLGVKGLKMAPKIFISFRPPQNLDTSLTMLEAVNLVFLIMAQQNPLPPRGSRPPQCRGFTITLNAPQSVELLWTSDVLIAETST